MIDTHTHIYLPEFDNDRDAVMERARSAGVNHFFLPAIDSSTHEAMMGVEASYEGCKSMMGLHPCSVNQDFEKELLGVEEWLDQRKFIAIGEIGLDFYWDRTFTEQQFEAFHRQIVLAMDLDLPIVIHSRNAITECIEVVRKYPGLQGVFHCFSGNVVQARQIMELGFFLGIGGVVSFKNSGLDKVVQEIGLSQLVLETDAPYLAPVPFRGKRNEPAYTRLVAEKMAALLNLTVEKVEELTTENAKNLFKL
ncbi:MAG: TatD family hydrolase [Flavisolibacter sp.]